MAPADLVIAAYNRSVPTATAVGNLKNNTSNGVISEPPPTPVKPTRVPTTKPETIYSKSTINFI